MNIQEITALIADDEAHMRTFVKLLLKNIGIEKVYQMHNGQDAVEAFTEYRPNIVLLDINMAKMNGLEALKKIREIDENATVIMMTAVSNRDAVEDSNRSGATFYILKTQPPAEIQRLLQRILEKRFQVTLTLKPEDEDERAL